MLQLWWTIPTLAILRDYWLHPCECAPPAWGMEKPVNPESFESVPGKSGNQFTPAPFELVAGQFVCPAKELLGQRRALRNRNGADGES